MGIRDEELKRVEKYAQGLGIKISYKKYKRGGDQAAWTVDGSEIELFLRNSDSKTQIILDLIHELGHHMHWIYNNRKIPIKLDIALGRENPTKKQRQEIYKDEINGAQYHLVIFKELGLKIPEWKVELERDLQLWIYKKFYVTGKWPTKKERLLVKKELTFKYKK